MQREYDVIVWGATGFTGELVSEFMADHYGSGNLTWCLAGRNRSKLDELKDEIDAEDIDVLIADSHDMESLEALVQKGRVVLTTVGPYARYGSQLVAACARHGTHYCDLTGEVHWMREMIDTHQQAARESGARIVHTCGFDSIPSDLGVYFLQREMIKQHGVPAREVKYRTRAFKGGASGGTIDSMMAMMEMAKTNPDIMRIMADPYALNDNERGLDGPDSNQPFFDPDFSSWVAPFVMAAINTRVVRRSNELLGNMYGREFRYSEGTLTHSNPLGALAAAGIAIGTSAMNTAVVFDPVRQFLQRFLPKPGEGPSEDTIENGFFEIELVAKHPTDDAKDLRCLISGDKDPGYGSTAKMLAETAVCLAQDDLPVDGGFWTPASAMGDALLERLPANAGVTFELI